MDLDKEIAAAAYHLENKAGIDKDADLAMAERLRLLSKQKWAWMPAVFSFCGYSAEELQDIIQEHELSNWRPYK